eukprot:g6268.t1
MCSSSSIKVLGTTPDLWNDVSSVKSYRPLNQLEWFALKPVKNQQVGIGLSLTSQSDGGIRFNPTSIGIYLDSKRTYWGPKPEKSTYEGWNTYFGNRLRRDPNNKSSDMQMAVDYTTNTVYYKFPNCYTIKFVLPKPFHGKPLYAHVQVWNSNTATLTTISEYIPFRHCCTENYLNVASFHGFNNKPYQVHDHVTRTTLRVSGGDWNGVNTVKTTRVLAQDEWIGAISTSGSQYGIGVSITGGVDGGIRMNQNTVGFYYDSKRSYWDSAEKPTHGGWNQLFSNRLVRDPNGFDGMWVRVDYTTNTLWLRYPYMKPISFVLPDSFKGKPLFGHYQVWNSCSIKHTYPMSY